MGINIGGAKKAGKGKRTCLNQIGCFASWGFKPVSQLSQSDGTQCFVVISCSSYSFYNFLDLIDDFTILGIYRSYTLSQILCSLMNMISSKSLNCQMANGCLHQLPISGLLPSGFRATHGVLKKFHYY